MANNRAWERRTGDWVAAQHRSKKRKAEAERLGKHGEDRRKYIAGQRP